MAIRTAGNGAEIKRIEVNETLSSSKGTHDSAETWQTFSSLRSKATGNSYNVLQEVQSLRQREPFRNGSQGAGQASYPH
ncbi:MAG: hypothetical protein WAL65_07530, partial [Candidatus Sulfotelmatobacter sp.]